MSTSGAGSGAVAEPQGAADGDADRPPQPRRPPPPPPSPPADDQLDDDEPSDRRPCFFRYITAISRVCGVLVCCLLWACAVYMLQRISDYEYTQWYTLALAIVVTFLEILFVINKLTCCNDDGNCCCTMWRAVLWIDNWKRGVLYFCLAIPDFISDGVVSPLGLACGAAMIFLGFVYILKSFKDNKCVEGKRSRRPKRSADSSRADLVSHEGQPDRSRDGYSSLEDSTAVQVDKDADTATSK